MSASGPRSVRDEGFTLVEIMVTMMIFVVVMALVIPTYLISSQSSTDTTSMTTDDTAMVPAVSRLASQLDNATYLWSPCDSTGTSYLNSGISTCQSSTSSGGPGGSAILLYYYVVGPQTGQQYGSVTNTVPSSGGATALKGYCSQWRVYNGLLQDRVWSSTSPPSSLAFNTIPTGLNITSNSKTGQPPFAVEGSSGNGSKIVDLDFMIRPTSSNSPNQEFQTSLAAQQALLARTLSSQPVPSCSPPATS